jgi:hypothetical protein
MTPAVPIVVVVLVDGVAVATIDPATWNDGTAVDRTADLSAALAVTTAQAIADAIADAT